MPQKIPCARRCVKENQEQRLPLRLLYVLVSLLLYTRSCHVRGNKEKRPEASSFPKSVVSGRTMTQETGMNERAGAAERPAADEPQQKDAPARASGPRLALALG